MRNYRHDASRAGSLCSDYLTSLAADKEGGIWIGSEFGGLDRLAAGSEEFIHVLTTADAGLARGSRMIISLAFDTGGSLWLAIYGFGLHRLDLGTGRVTSYLHDPRNPCSLSSDNVLKLLVDREGTLWAGTSTGGLNRLDPRDGSFARYSHDPADPSAFPNGMVVDIFEDEAGSLWLAIDGGGAAVWHRSTAAFRGLGSDKVRAIHQDSRGIMWLGTNQGVSRLDPSGGPAKSFRHDPADPGSLSSNSVYAVFEDRRGDLWVGTYLGLDRLVRADGSFVRYRHDPTNPRSLSDDLVYAISEDAAGRLWIGTRSGLNLYDPVRGDFTVFKNDPSNAESLGRDMIYCLRGTADGSLWIGTRDGGVDRYESDAGRWTHFVRDPKDPASLSNNIVNSIFESSSGELWVGTSGGLNRLDRSTGRFTRYVRQDGLPSDSIIGILEDGAGALWLSTFQGLSRFDPREESFMNYGQADGLKNSEYQIFAYCRSRSGELWFGGVKGIDIVDPSKIAKNTRIPPVILTGLELNNRVAAIGGDSPLAQSIEAAQEIAIDFSYRVVTFKFASLNYVNSQRNRFKYKLEGFDRDWVATDSSRPFATYTNLDPGSYRFKVVGSNNDGVWNEVGAALDLLVIPPWWRSWWFYSLCAGIFLLIAGFIYRTKTAQRMAERAAAAAVKESEEKYRLIVDNQSDLVVKTGPEGILEFVSPSYCRLFGKSEGELLGKNFSPLTHKDDREPTDRAMEALRAPPFAVSLEQRTLTAAGWRWISWAFTALRDDVGQAKTVIGIGRDITERKTYVDQMRESLSEKEVLLREIHHRVKNNLSIVSSLLSLQSDEILTPAQAQAAFATCRDRIMAMAQVHEELYRSDNLSIIDMGDYLESLTRRLISAYAPDGRIRWKVESERVPLSIEAAVPCGLILNELIVNSMKYAFPEDRAGEIRVSLRIPDDHVIEISISDDGIGLPGKDEPKKSGSLGLTLVAILVDQLGGTKEYRADGGTTWKIVFPKDGKPAR